jgi:hypothetical protein
MKCAGDPRAKVQFHQRNILRQNHKELKDAEMRFPDVSKYQNKHLPAIYTFTTYNSLKVR